MKNRIVLCSVLITTLLLGPLAQARYLNPETGRFQTMDSYEGDSQAPQSQHKYVYCQNNPANGIDPSGHFLASPVAPSLDVLITMSTMTQMRQAEARAKVPIPGHIAARGFVKWAWLTGGIGLGVQYLLEDTQLAMDIQVQVQANPTASQYAYQNYKCVEFAQDAEQVFRRRGKQPQRIIYQSFPRRTVGDNIMAAPGFGFFEGENISINGHHEGVLVEGRVYDPNVPFGVPRIAWENGYLVTSYPGYVEMTIGQAARPSAGLGSIIVR